MKAVVISVKENRAAVLMRDGSLRYVENRGYEKGSILELPDTDNAVISFEKAKTRYNLRFPRRFAYSAAASFAVLMLSGAMVSFACPASTVALSSDPEVTLGVNVYGRVVEINAGNDENEELLREIKRDMKGRGLPEVSRAIELKFEEHREKAPIPNENSSSDAAALSDNEVPLPSSEGILKDNNPAPEIREDQAMDQFPRENEGGQDTESHAPEIKDESDKENPAPENKDEKGKENPAPEIRDDRNVDNPPPENHGGQEINNPAPGSNGDQDIINPVPEIREDQVINNPVPEIREDQVINNPVPEIREEQVMDNPAPEIREDQVMDNPPPENHEDQVMDNPPPENREDRIEEKPEPREDKGGPPDKGPGGH
ncbi:MAG: hypothetical protein IJU87_03975 [Lachnospiraceae bacterium]|nr:hypothetical protein [Lachnospiraceae bacterium]